MTNEHAYQMARSFPEFLAAVEAKKELWHALAARAPLFPEEVERVAAVPGSWRLLVIADDWCGDAVNTVPVVSRLAEAAPNLELRVVGREEVPDLMDRHLTAGARAIPVILLLDEDGEERGWWGPRPRELQDWFQRMGRDMPIEERYKEMRRWHARDRGATAVSEIADLVAEARGPGFPREPGRGLPDSSAEPGGSAPWPQSVPRGDSTVHSFVPSMRR
jgi:hypothetical protein